MQKHKVSFIQNVNGKPVRRTLVWEVKKSSFVASEFVQDAAKNGITVERVISNQIMKKARGRKVAK